MAYIRDSSDFISKNKSLNNLLINSILVKADGVSLYPSIPHESDLNAIKEALDNRERKSVPTEDIIKMREFVLIFLKVRVTNQWFGFVILMTSF